MKLFTKLSLLSILSLSGIAQGVWFDCRAQGVAVYTQRVHIRCANSAGAIRYFAMRSSANRDFVNRTLTVANTAVVAGKIIKIQYNPNDTSGQNVGCGAADCRLIQAVEIIQ